MQWKHVYVKIVQHLDIHRLHAGKLLWSMNPLQKPGSQDRMHFDGL